MRKHLWIYTLTYIINRSVFYQQYLHSSGGRKSPLSHPVAQSQLMNVPLLHQSHYRYMSVVISKDAAK